MKFNLWKGVLALLLGLSVTASIRVSAQQTTPGAGRRSGAGSRGASASYPANGMIGEAMISSDPETRRIIVITDEETSKHIGQVITNLDKPKPQVLIKVVFLEVTYGNSSDIGLEGSFSKKLGNSTTGSATNLFSLAALGASGLTPGAGGMYQILGNDFQATLRAIAEAGKTEVLSRPSIMARNNQQAVIMVGQRIPIITGSQVNALTGGINNTISYQDVGIILRVTPFISSDGMVEMIVAPEISSLANDGVSISTGTNATFNAPVINNRSAETVVVTPDGKPVIIGGLMENKKLDSTRKIPLLGDIPLLGNAFKRKVKQDTKSELVIFLTPHIVNRPSQMAALTESERNQSVLAPKAFSNQELERFVDGLPVKKETPPDPSQKPAKKKSSSGK